MRRGIGAALIHLRAGSRIRSTSAHLKGDQFLVSADAMPNAAPLQALAHGPMPKRTPIPTSPFRGVTLSVATAALLACASSPARSDVTQGVRMQGTPPCRSRHRVMWAKFLPRSLDPSVSFSQEPGRDRIVRQLGHRSPPCAAMGLAGELRFGAGR